MSDMLDEIKDNIKVAGLLLLFILVSPLFLIGYAHDYIEKLIFRFSKRYRRKEFQQLEKVRRRGDIDWNCDSEFFRNKDEMVLDITTDEALYPKCKVRLLIPETSGHYEIDMSLFQRKEYYSVQVPGKFQSDYSDGSIEDLYDQKYLYNFQKKHHLEDAIVVLNYTSFIQRLSEKVACCIYILPPEHKTCDCFIELLSETKPEGLDCETIVYYIYDFPKECNLVRHCLTRLDESSERLLSTFRVYIDKRLAKLREYVNKDTFFSKEQVSYIKEYILHPQSDM